MIHILKTILPKSLLFRLHQIKGLFLSLKFSNVRLSKIAIGDIPSEYRERIDDVISSPDNSYIKRVPNAGELDNGLITMHNGIQLNALGYYGSGILNMLVENRGVHEPQEERAFAEILRYCQPGSVMIELGAYWGFYSLWFAKTVKDATCYLIEPNFSNLCSGKKNFSRYGIKAHFKQAFVGASDGMASNGTPIVTIDSLFNTLQHISILHADIQGAEVDMLSGCKSFLEGKRIDYLFLSTHSNELHYKCLDLLKSYEYIILTEADMNETYSFDGLIVAKCDLVKKPEALCISKKTTLR